MAWTRPAFSAKPVWFLSSLLISLLRREIHTGGIESQKILQISRFARIVAYYIGNNLSEDRLKDSISKKNASARAIVNRLRKRCDYGHAKAYTYDSLSMPLNANDELAGKIRQVMKKGIAREDLKHRLPRFYAIHASNGSKAYDLQFQLAVDCV